MTARLVCVIVLALVVGSGAPEIEAAGDSESIYCLKPFALGEFQWCKETDRPPPIILPDSLLHYLTRDTLLEIQLRITVLEQEIDVLRKQVKALQKAHARNPKQRPR